MSLSLITGNYYFDVAGTAMIGLLLVRSRSCWPWRPRACCWARPRAPEAQERIAVALRGTPGIERIIHMKTLHLGPEELLVGAKIAVSASDTALRSPGRSTLPKQPSVRRSRKPR